MSPPAPPTLTVRHDGTERTFAAGHDVVVGRDLRADMRITHPLISRAHLLLRFDQGRWLAIDNDSLNGTFVNGRRVPLIDIQRRPVRQHRKPRRAAAGLRGRTAPGHGRSAAADRVDARPAAGRRPDRPTAGHPGPARRRRPARQPQLVRSAAAAAATIRRAPRPAAGATDVSQQRSTTLAPAGYPVSGPPPATPNYPQAPPTAGATSPDATRRREASGDRETSRPRCSRPCGRRTGSHEIPAGSVTLGRSTDNDIVIQDVLASRHHASF